MKKDNSFDLLRLIFAVFMLITHSYPLTGIEEKDYLYHLTNGQLWFSYIGVRGFFIISGYLILKSVLRSKNVKEYFLKRFFRIYHALIVVCIISAFVLGPVISKYSLLEYFKSTQPYLYLFSNIQLIFNIGNNCILDVFALNPYNCCINGSLWTIPFEILFYVGISFLFVFKSSNIVAKKSILIFVFLILFSIRLTIFDLLKINMYVIPKTVFSFTNITELGLFFIGGSILAIFDFEMLVFKTRVSILVFSILVLILSCFLNMFELVQYIVLPFFIISLGLIDLKIRTYSELVGDISYGVYLYGFPIQQVLVYLFHLEQTNLLILSVICSLFFGFISWKVVEQRSLVFLKEKILH